ncbi:DUF6148 family protein [Cohnella sp. GCM10012308]|uniref:DUF6148 family protein n=1 Tax=Cohnella sp. GCM10012308 TaxID=3317329 RepID=UPI00360B7224
MPLPKEQIQLHLDAWYAADLAVSTGQSYTIGTRSLTRANLKEIRDSIAYWERKLAEAESGRSGARVMRVVPRDL